MFALPISKPLLKSLFFNQNSPKMKLFLQKHAKFSSLRRLGALPPNPQPPAAGGFAPRPPLASCGWGLRPHTPQTAPPLRISGYASAYFVLFCIIIYCQV